MTENLIRNIKDDVADIFLSYQKNDLARIKPLAAALSARGWSVFYDRTTPPGKTWRQKIETELSICSCMVVAWSKSSIDSHWVLEEADEGRERGILVPCLLDDVKPPFGFRSIQAANLLDWHGDNESAGLKLLCEVIQDLLPTVALEPLPSVLPGTAHSPDWVIEPEMIAIPAGSFAMGGDQYDNEKPIHTVTFAKPFKLGKYPVTFAEYDVFVEQTARVKPEDEGWGRGRRPAINVTWQDAVDYAVWLRETTGKAYRLPSEAEWEYACRAGAQSEFFWGDDAGLAKHYAWFDQNAAGTTQEVGLKLANLFGLYDMAGNVWEWLQDGWYEDYQGAPNDGSARIGGYGGRRVIRSGSCGNSSAALRSAHRLWSSPEYRFNFLGFRLAQDLP
ncbi:SUMF1/EgtB/PvdO family nonheme iron enzyme [Methylomonas sp. MED-D]|uniref:SUMF1/EgtB/PvdO family nonheme iron enzyme n=1 Tax=unclassified Methylomonas TaxID=2608980 RepID=UPI0028A43F5D|nr:SUMF1/EgtB/PvdO family nonheme iron enzyme [Methylomonas sp. MV1]MDT4331008.1 SUMF1/EgtB/PvdO family nonheme iron enzyme [Methylomonas sp. MV1]